MEFSPQGRVIQAIHVPEGLPAAVDHPENFLLSTVPEAVLLLALTELLPAAHLITALAKLCGAETVITAVNNPAWLPPGLRNQIKR